MGLRGAFVALILIIGVGGCSNPLARQYEYDEQTYLEVDGSATVVVSASVAALVALRGLPLDPSPDARIDTNDVRQVFEAAGCTVDRVSRPWRRAGRRFVQAQFSVEDITKAAGCGPLAWSTYSFQVGASDEGDARITYRQTVGAPTGTVPAGVGWNGSELVVFKLHLPSKVIFHNVRLLENPQEVGSVARGNILAWEQHLTTRLSGAPLAMEVITDAESILHQTMYLFAGAFAAAVIVLITIIWLVIRRGRVRLKELRR